MEQTAFSPCSISISQDSHSQAGLTSISEKNSAAVTFIPFFLFKVLSTFSVLVKMWHCFGIYYRYMTEYYTSSVPWPLLSGWIEILRSAHCTQVVNPSVGGGFYSWKSSHDSDSLSKWTGRSTSTPPTKPHICNIGVNNKRELHQNFTFFMWTSFVHLSVSGS